MVETEFIVGGNLKQVVVVLQSQRKEIVSAYDDIAV